MTGPRAAPIHGGLIVLTKGSNMPEEQQVEIKMKDVGSNDQLQYAKADIAKACRIGNSYAVSFYQLDYNAIANAATNRASVDDIRPIPVAKIVMDEGGFKQFLNELTSLVEKLPK